MLYITWITDSLAVGPALTNIELEQLKDVGIDAIVDVRSEETDNEDLLKDLDIDFLHINADDRYCPTRKQLNSIFQFVNPLLEKNKKIFVHCQNGYGRSPLVIISILVNRGMSISDAVSLLYDKHPTASFTPQQEKFIYSLEDILR